MLNALYNKPNNIVERQKIIQNDTRQLWYRLPRSTFYMRAYYTTFAVGMLASLYGSFSLIRGKNN